MKTKLFLMVTLLCFVFAGCKEKEVDLSGGMEDGAPVKESNNSTKKTKIKATITYQGLGLMDAADDGNWIKSIDMGESVYIIGEQPPKKGNWRPVEIQLQDSDKTTGFANAWFVIPESKPAVTVSDAKIFTEPKTTKMTKNKIPKMHIIAVSNDAYEKNFAKVNYSLDEYAKPECYLSADDFSTVKDDVEAVRLFNLAATQTDAEMQISFLEEASKIGSPSFGMDIDGALVRVKNGETLEDILNEKEGGAAESTDDDSDSEMMMEDDSDDGMGGEM